VSHVPLLFSDVPLMKCVAKAKEGERRNRKINWLYLILRCGIRFNANWLHSEWQNVAMGHEI
jgi:hypothetical protein